MARLQKDLREFVELLNSHAVDFLVVGAHCVAWHGAPRYTGDIDLYLRREPENARHVMNVIEAFGFGSLELTADDFLRENSVIQLGVAPNRIDLLTDIDGVSFEEAWAERERADLDGVPVFMASRQTLITNKKAAGRPQDLADVARLLELS
jgi:hypothetical protein